MNPLTLPLLGESFRASTGAPTAVTPFDLGLAAGAGGPVPAIAPAAGRSADEEDGDPSGDKAVPSDGLPVDPMPTALIPSPLVAPTIAAVPTSAPVAGSPTIPVSGSAKAFPDASGHTLTAPVAGKPATPPISAGLDAPVLAALREAIDQARTAILTVPPSQRGEAVGASRTARPVPSPAIDLTKLPSVEPSSSPADIAPAAASAPTAVVPTILPRPTLSARHAATAGSAIAVEMPKGATAVPVPVNSRPAHPESPTTPVGRRVAEAILVAAAVIDPEGSREPGTASRAAPANPHPAGTTDAPSTDPPMPRSAATASSTVIAAPSPPIVAPSPGDAAMPVLAPTPATPSAIPVPAPPIAVPPPVAPRAASASRAFDGAGKRDIARGERADADTTVDAAPVSAPATPAATSSPAVSPQPAGPPPAAGGIDRALDVARQAAWIDGIARDVARAGDGGGDARFAVASDHLGAIAVTVARRDGAAEIVLTAADPAARAVLDAGRDRLAEQAKAHGLELRSVRIEAPAAAASTGDQRGDVVATNSLTTGSYGGGVGGNSGGQPQHDAQPRPQPRQAARAGGAATRGRSADGRYA